MKGQAFVAFASKIAVLHNEEASRRTAISRAYYGAFHEALELLRIILPSVDAIHGNVWLDYLHADHPLAPQIGQALRDLHSQRVAADYRLDDAQARDLAFQVECVETAESIVAWVQKLAENLNDITARERFIQSIAGYRAKIGRRT